MNNYLPRADLVMPRRTVAGTDGAGALPGQLPLPGSPAPSAKKRKRKDRSPSAYRQVVKRIMFLEEFIASRQRQPVDPAFAHRVRLTVEQAQRDLEHLRESRDCFRRRHEEFITPQS